MYLTFLVMITLFVYMVFHTIVKWFFCSVHNDSNLTIMDDKGKILLVGTYTKRRCFKNTLNIRSPVGFLLGSVKERYIFNAI